MGEEITTDLLGRLIRETGERALTPQEEGLGWLLAERLGLIDGIGGGEWRWRVAEGLISEAAASLLYELNPDFRPPAPLTRDFGREEQG